MSLEITRIKFIGRKQELELYQRFLRERTPWLWLLAGMPGTGKSTLLDHLEDLHASSFIHIKLDFANVSLTTDPLKILEALSWRLAAYCAPESVQAFDDMLKNARRARADNAFSLMSFLSQLDLVPVAESSQESITGISQKELDAEQSEQDFVAQVEAAFYEQIQTCTLPHGQQLVLVFDTCEWINEFESAANGEWMTATLIPQIHAILQCHVVIASRTYPQMKKVPQQDQLMYSMPMLDQDAVLDYLREIGINNEKDRLDIYQLTHGHPLCLSIMSSLWLGRDEKEKIVDVPLRYEFTEQALVELVQDRLDRRLKSPFREWTHYGVLLRRFNWECMRRIFHELLELPDVYGCFEQFSDYSYIKNIGDRSYEIHELFREVLVSTIQRLEPDKWRLYHQRAFDYWSNRGDPEQYYHAFALNDYRGMLAWHHEVQTSLEAKDTEKTIFLQRLFADNTFQLSEFGRCLYHYARGDEARSAGNRAEAIHYYQQALAFWHDASTTGSVQQTFSQHEKETYATLAYTLGSLQAQDATLRSQARQSYQQGRELFRDLKDQLREARCLQALGALDSVEDIDSALEAYEQALALLRQLGMRSPEASALLALAPLQVQKSEQVFSAFQTARQAQQIFHELGETRSEAAAWQAIGDLYLRQSSPAADNVIRRFFRTVRHQRNPSAEVDAIQKPWYAAIEAYQEAFNLYQSLSAPARMIDLAETIGDIYLQHNRVKAAIGYYERALELFPSGPLSGEQSIQSRALLHAKLGDAYAQRYSRQKARQQYQRASVLFGYTNDSKNINRVLFSEKHNTSIFSWWWVRPQPWFAISVGLVLLIVVGVLSSIFLDLLRPPQSPANSSNPCLSGVSVPITIQITTTASACGQESIGVSDGSYAFDAGQGNVATDDKNVAAGDERAGDLTDALAYWENAYTDPPNSASAATNDAESRIYAEDIRVEQSHQPYITMVVVTILTPTNGFFIGGGRDLLQGAYLAQKVYNQQCYGQHCALLRLLVANIGSNPNYAPFVAQQIVNIAHHDPTIIGVLGSLNSQPTVNVVPIFQAAHIPLLSSTATSDKLTGISPYFFRIIPPDTQQGIFAAHYAEDTLKVKHVVVFLDANDAYSSSLGNAFRNNFQVSSGQTLTTVKYTIGETNNLLNEVNQALASNPDLIYFAGYARDASSILVDINSKNSSTRLMGGDAFFIPGDYTPTARKSNFQGVYFTSFAYIDPTHPQANTPQQQRFLQAYISAYDPYKLHALEYGYELADTDTILSYDAIDTYIQAYQNVLTDGIKLSPEAMRTGLSQIDSQHPYVGVGGTIAFATNGNPINKTVLMLHSYQSLSSIQKIG